MVHTYTFIRQFAGTGDNDWAVFDKRAQEYPVVENLTRSEAEKYRDEYEARITKERNKANHA